jgi:PAS domain S-box-containing protein
VIHTHEVIDTLEDVLGHIREAEVVEQTYLITGDERRLPEITANIDAANQKVKRVKVLTDDNPDQQARIPKIQQRIEEVAGCWSNSMKVRKEQGFDAARQVIVAGKSSEAMIDLQGLLGQMEETERALLRNRAIKSERTYFWALVTGLFIGVVAVGGVVAFMFLLRRHVAARVAAAATFAEQAERLRTTLASIGDAVMTTDTDGRITSLNTVAESLTGWQLDQAAGQPLEVVFRIVNEQTHRSVENPATRALREGVIVGLANHTVLIHKDGTQRPIDDSAAPIRCKEGEVVGCVLVFRDVTERRRAEDMLRQSEEQARQNLEFLDAVTSNMGEGLYAVDAQGLVTYMNPAAEAMLGWTFEELKGRRMHDMTHHHHPDGRPFPLEDCAGFQVLHQGKVLKDYDDYFIKKDGSFFPVTYSSSPQRSGEKVVGLVVVFRDSTERKRAEEALRKLAADLSESNHRKEEFLATLAHELRNPLAPIRNALTILNLASDNPEMLGQAREMMTRQVSQMVRLIDDLLDLSRINRGKLELRKERVELALVIHQAVESCRPLADGAKHDVSVTLPPQPVYLNADPIRLIQVFSNLLDNACKFTSETGRISMTGERHRSDVLVAVKDTGIGIPPDKIDSIFEMFSQVDRSLEKSHGGLGIGLTLVKRLVEMHGGSIEVRSDGLGKGSEFIIRLPVIIEAQPPAPTGEPKDEIRPSGPRRILVVDDNRDSVESLTMLLRLNGNEMHIAYDGEQAVEVASNVRPDVILLDIGLPKLNGYEACRRIREKRWAKNTIIIALTGWGQEDYRQKSTEVGFNGHLVKPVDHAALTKLMAELLTAHDRKHC